MLDLVGHCWMVSHWMLMSFDAKCLLGVVGDHCMLLDVVGIWMSLDVIECGWMLFEAD